MRNHQETLFECGIFCLANFRICATVYNCFCFFFSCFLFCFLFPTPPPRWEGDPALLLTSSSSEKLLSVSSVPSFSGNNITAYKTSKGLLSKFLLFMKSFSSFVIDSPECKSFGIQLLGRDHILSTVHTMFPRII